MSPGPSGALPESTGHSWKRSGPGSVTDLPPRTPWALASSLEWTSQLLDCLPSCRVTRTQPELLVLLAPCETEQKELQP